MEKVKQKYKNMFILCISHELRTPLNGILGTAEILEQGGIPQSEIIGLGSQIHNSGYLLKHLIESVQDLSQIDANTFKLQYSWFSPKESCTKCLDCIAFEFAKRGVEVEVLGYQELPEGIFSDRERYSEVFLALLINAAKYTFQGAVKITLEYNEELGYLRTRIEDTGIGINPEFFPYMFSLYGKVKMGLDLGIEGEGKDRSSIEGSIYNKYNR